MKREFTLIIDDREQAPFPLPNNLAVANWHLKPDLASVNMVRRRLRTGDYALEGYEGVCLIERKFDMREISKNLMTKDRKRFLGTLDRLRDECTHPILMLEGSPITVQRETTYTDHPFVVVDSLQRECRIRGIELMLIPGYTPVMRRAAGEWVVRTLINAALVHDIRGKSNGNDADCNDHQHQVD